MDDLYDLEIFVRFQSVHDLLYGYVIVGSQNKRPDVFDFGRNSKAEQDYLYDRHDQKYHNRASIP